MKSKKIVALGLAVIMTASMLAGCGDTKESTAAEQSSVQESSAETQGSVSVEESSVTVEEKKEIVFPLDEPLVVTGMGVVAKETFPYEDNIAWQYVRDLTNVTVEMQGFSSSEAKEKMNLLVAGGDYPEILYKCPSSSALKNYAEDGVLIPLEDLIRDYAPNLTKLLDERDAWEALEYSDGHIYSLPLISKQRSLCDAMYYWINQEWLDKVEMKMPTNQDELYQVLKAFKEQDPNGNGQQDEIPFVIEGGTNANSLSEMLAYMGEGLYYGYYWMVMDGEMEYLPTTDYFKENYLKYFKKLYDEGLINDDAFTITTDQVEAVGKSGSDVYGMVWGSSPSKAISTGGDQTGWVSFKPFNTDNFALGQGIQMNGFSITDKCENPEVMMAWVDFFYSEEGGRVLRMGVEGVSYELSADGTTYKTISDGFESVTYQATLMGSATLPGKVPEIYYSGQDPEVNANAAWVNKELYGEGYGSQAVGVTCPSLVYTQEEEDARENIDADISSYVKNYVAETITGLQSIDETWDEFQSTLKKMGVDTLIEIQRAAYERANSAE